MEYKLVYDDRAGLDGGWYVEFDDGNTAPVDLGDDFTDGEAFLAIDDVAFVEGYPPPSRVRVYESVDDDEASWVMERHFRCDECRERLDSYEAYEPVHVGGELRGWKVYEEVGLGARRRLEYRGVITVDGTYRCVYHALEVSHGG